MAAGVAVSRSMLLALAVALAGCASVDPYAAPPMAHHLQRDDVLGYCARLFADIDRRIDSLGVRDAEARRSPDFRICVSTALTRRLAACDGRGARASVARQAATAR